MVARAICGFPSPADDYLDRPLDFNELIIENAAATFAVRVEGESMIGVGIFPGDIAVVNRARQPTDQCIVVALLDGEFTIKRYRRRGARVWIGASVFQAAGTGTRKMPSPRQAPSAVRVRTFTVTCCELATTALRRRPVGTGC
jgi:hypothetical protein